LECPFVPDDDTILTALSLAIFGHARRRREMSENGWRMGIGRATV
jgi:hypothetical protein